MLKRLNKRVESGEVGRPGGKGLSSDALGHEISHLLKEKPKALFAATSPAQLTFENFGNIVEGSSRLIPTFIAMVVVPTVLMFLYLVFVAMPQYESEQTFTVQQGTKSQRSLTGVMALAAQFSGFSTTSQETYMVLEYLRSANAINDIGGVKFLESVYSKDDIDYFSRLEKGLPVEDVQKYWESKIIPELDVRSGILTLKVRAFSAEDAYMLSKKLMDLSEKLANEVSQRSRDLTLTRVENDLERSVQLLAKSRSDILAFRNAEGSIDPTKDAEQIGVLLTELTTQRIQLETEIGAVTTQVNSNSPTIKVKREQVAAIEQQISELEGRLTGLASKDASVAKKLVDYERLKTDLMYYERLYAVSLSTYEQAREETIKQQIFVVPIVAPALSESANYPSRFEVTAAVFMLGLALWTVSSMIIAAIKDHRI